MLGAAFGDALAAALAGRDLVLDNGFGPDTERALIDVAFARDHADGELAASARTVFVAETAARMVSPQSPDDAAMLVLSRMAHCSLLEWDAARTVPLDIEQVRFHRDCRRGWLARLTAADTRYVDLIVETLRWAAMKPTPVPQPPARVESGVLAAIFEHDIVPETFLAAGPRGEPSALVLCRSAARHQDTVRIAAERRCVVVDPDLYTAYHPRAAVAVDADVLGDVVLWMVMAIRHAVERRLDVVVRTAADEPRQTSDVTALFDDSGYRITIGRTPPAADM
ncbi:hypothetical protein EBN03_11770 [Nocardia stercoris]|uniref:UDP-N-acetylglucosamine kinase n=1 Tax=Nocardia stercoris TaxID=2483361 RepID=A0A3M2L7V7_9NOCA|nr:hypothetical protein EBN03_11770 [Nocardia stercoris]